MIWKFLLYAYIAVDVFADFDVTTDVTFRLFTQNDKFVGVNLGFNARNLTDAGFSFNRDTKFITHGFLNNGSGMSCIALRDAYLEKYDVNVIIVDYAPIGNAFLTLPQTKITLVGEYTATFVDFLIKQGYSGGRIHMMGHSLGAHVIGNAARRTAARIARVTGLDPGLMLPDPLQLDDSVADFVDVIHTARGTYGVISSNGHVDFYPNGGFIQPNCLILPLTCSHYEAVRYFVRSIRVANRYRAFKCESKVAFYAGKCRNNTQAFMGVDVSTTARGDFYLTTPPEGSRLS